eukprot:m.124439 g.124439  ORF g.124439 m.124439 type:complete len:275 (-) comp15708_c0_seq6:1341-2165(-)
MAIVPPALVMLFGFTLLHTGTADALPERCICNVPTPWSDAKEGLSIIVMNHQRPHNLHKSLPAMAKYDNVDEIVVVHSQLSTMFNTSYPKVKYVDMRIMNQELGAAKRTHVVTGHKNVLFLDDDVQPTEAYIDKLLEAQRNGHPDGFYGHEPRICNQRAGYSYPQTAIGKSPYLAKVINAILTPILLTSAHYLSLYKVHFHHYRQKLHQTGGNGEDLCMNHFLVQYLGIQPTYVPAQKEDIIRLDSGHGYSGKSGHHTTRIGVCRWLGSVKLWD